MKLKTVATGKVAGLYAALEKGNFGTVQVTSIDFTIEGIPGDRHSGITKPAGARENQFIRNATIRNNRHWSAVTVEEMQVITSNLGLHKLKPEWIGANLLVSGIENFTQLPALTHLYFGNVKNPSCVLVVYQQNKPCKKPNDQIDFYSNESRTASFVSAAKDLRGLVGWVELPGRVEVGQAIHALTPV